MECPICLNEINKKQRCFQKKILNSPCCSQTLHKKCLLIWLKDNNTCPLCRERLDIVSVPSGKICIPINKKILFKTSLILITIIVFGIMFYFADYKIIVGIMFSFTIIVLLLMLFRLITSTTIRDQCLYDENPIRHYKMKSIIIHIPN